MTFIKPKSATELKNPYSDLGMQADRVLATDDFLFFSHLRIYMLVHRPVKMAHNHLSLTTSSHWLSYVDRKA